MSRIRFGTSGWRGIIADEFTFERSRLVVAAIARHLSDSGEADRGVLVGHDTRFLGEEFAADAARLLSDLGIDVWLCSDAAPTPAISALVLKRGFGGAINFTASHNPSLYQGIKFSPSWGGPAMPESTRAIEETVEIYQRDGLPQAAPGRGCIKSIDPVPEYLDKLRSRVDVDLIAGSGLRIAFDALYGTGSNYLDRLLLESGCKVTVINRDRDPLFGGFPPEPSSDRLEELGQIVSASADIGVSTDGDADRFGVLGDEGEFYTPNIVLAMLADYLIRVRGLEGDIARSVATTAQLDDIAAAFGRTCHETPVGFKYIGRMISEGRLAMGGEESAGMSIRDHIPEKDGILACLLVAEMVAASGKSLSLIKDQLQNTYGPRFSRRINIQLTDELSSRLRQVLESPPMKVGDLKAENLLTLDGTKWLFKGGEWALLRLSGTEPVARLYLETGEESLLNEYENVYTSWITGSDRNGSERQEGCSS